MTTKTHLHFDKIDVIPCTHKISLTIDFTLIHSFIYWYEEKKEIFIANLLLYNLHSPGGEKVIYTLLFLSNQTNKEKDQHANLSINRLINITVIWGIIGSKMRRKWEKTFTQTHQYEYLFIYLFIWQSNSKRKITSL